MRWRNTTSPTGQSRCERPSTSHPMSTIRGVRWEAEFTTEYRMQIPNRKLAEVRREITITDVECRASCFSNHVCHVAQNKLRHHSTHQFTVIGQVCKHSEGRVIAAQRSVPDHMALRHTAPQQTAWPMYRYTVDLMVMKVCQRQVHVHMRETSACAFALSRMCYVAGQRRDKHATTIPGHDFRGNDQEGEILGQDGI